MVKEKGCNCSLFPCILLGSNNLKENTMSPSDERIRVNISKSNMEHLDFDKPKQPGTGKGPIAQRLNSVLENYFKITAEELKNLTNELEPEVIEQLIFAETFKDVERLLLKLNLQDLTITQKSVVVEMI